jgi:hypothetical protein
MEIVMKNVEYRTKFETALFSMFPDVAATGKVTRSQLIEVLHKNDMKSYPTWITCNKIGRGLYMVKSDTQEVVKEEKVMSFKSDTPVISMIPEKDANFVPFGNFGDLESIIKSGIFTQHSLLVQPVMVNQQ